MILGQRLHGSPWHPVWPLLTPQAWNVLSHVPGGLPVSVLGAPRRSRGLGFPRLCCGRERASFPRRRLGLLVLTDLSCFCGTDNTLQLAGAEWPCTWVFCHCLHCGGVWDCSPPFQNTCFHLPPDLQKVLRYDCPPLTLQPPLTHIQFSRFERMGHRERPGVDL